MIPLWLALTIVAALLAVGPIWRAVRNWRERSIIEDEGMEIDASE